MEELIITGTVSIENIRYEVDNANYFSNKIVPYNASSNIPLHKFWVYIDKSKVTKNVIVNNLTYLTVALSLKTECIKYIKLIEKQFNKKIEDDKISELKVISRLRDIGTSVPVFELVIDLETVMFDKNGKMFNIPSDVKIGTELKIICELDHFMCGTNKLESIWRIVQLQKMESIDLTVPLFGNFSKSIPTPITIAAIQPIKHVTTDVDNHSHNHVSKAKAPIADVPIGPPKKTAFTLPSAKDLQNAISGLKKVADTKSTDTDTDINNNVINVSSDGNSTKEIPQLKHVETREVNVYQMLKNEHKIKTDKANKMELEYKNIQKIDELHKKVTKCRNKLHDNISFY